MKQTPPKLPLYPQLTKQTESDSDSDEQANDLLDHWLLPPPVVPIVSMNNTSEHGEVASVTPSPVKTRYLAILQRKGGFLEKAKKLAKRQRKIARELQKIRKH